MYEEIPATSADENQNEEVMTHATTAEETEIPRHEEPEIAIPEVVM